MPFASKKQQRYFHYLANQGKLPQSINLQEYDKATDFKHLPNHMAHGGEVPELANKFHRLKKMFGGYR